MLAQLGGDAERPIKQHFKNKYPIVNNCKQTRRYAFKPGQNI